MINNKVLDHNARKQPRPRSREEQRLARDQIVIVIDKIINKKTIFIMRKLRDQSIYNSYLQYIIFDKTVLLELSQTSIINKMNNYTKKMKEYLDSESGRNR